MAINLPLACRQIRVELGEYYAFKFNSFGVTDTNTSDEVLSRASLWEPLSSGQINSIEKITTNYIFEFTPHRFNKHLGLSRMKNLKLLVLRELDRWFTEMDADEKEETLEAFRKEIGNEALEIVFLDLWDYTYTD
jgi:hypothetical protein